MNEDNSPLHKKIDAEGKVTTITFYTENSKMAISSPPYYQEELKEEADNLDMTLSAAVRYWIQLGRMSMIQNDPRNSTYEKGESNPIKNLIPEGKENAIDIRDELPRKIEDSLLDVVDDDVEIKRDGFEVYL